MRRVIAAWQPRVAAFVTCFALAGLGCATPPDPFQVPEAEVRAQVRTVALVPLVASQDLVEVERVRSVIEPRAIAMLREGGFAVIPPDEWEQRWLAAAREAGEIWDPVTGARDDERYGAVRDELLRTLQAERNVDAVVYVYLFRQPVEGSGPSPLLCEVQRDVYWPRELPLSTRVTLAYGACLQVEMYDTGMRQLYRLRHGVEFVDTYARQTHASKPLAERVRDPALLEEALATTLGPLATRETP